ncbi:hypothetical protein AQJ58_09470 [Streptomyces sp. DSM 15324]|nr:hypothetical protein AQJ58_09470 [Streptomyces sp. DSM 15324]
MRKGRPWSLPLKGVVLLVAAYGRTDLTLRRPTPPFEDPRQSISASEHTPGSQPPHMRTPGL